MDGGSIELLSGDGKALAVLKLSNPAAKDAAGGEFEFNKIAEGDAVLAGQAKFARVVASDGSEIFSCDVGDRDLRRHEAAGAHRGAAGAARRGTPARAFEGRG